MMVNMHPRITRRDFVHDVGLAALGLLLPLPGLGAALDSNLPYYPPTLTGLRGAHLGSFEVAHALAREGRHFDNPQALDEAYDLSWWAAASAGSRPRTFTASGTDRSRGS